MLELGTAAPRFRNKPVAKRTSSLLSKALNALSSLEKDKTRPASNQLKAMSNAIRAQSGKKLAESQASLLLGMIETIQNAIAAEGPRPARLLRSSSPEEPVTLNVSAGDSFGYPGLLLVSWPSQWGLYESETLHGDWAPVHDATSPFWVAPDGEATVRLFRLQE